MFFTITLIITLALFVTPALIVFQYDPYFFLHKKYADKMGFDKTDRYQNAGLINSWLDDDNENVDVIIIGTSMSQNMPVSAWKNEQGVNALKLTLAGGEAKEQALIARKAISTGNVREVIWEVFTPYVAGDTEQRHAQSPLPVFLYNQSIWDDWRYFFNNDVFEDALKVIIGKNKKRELEMENLYTWENKDDFKRFSSETNLVKLKGKLRQIESPLSFSRPENYDSYVFPNVDKNLFSIIRNNPEIKFSLYFPPVSYFSYASGGNEEFWKLMAMRHSVLKLAQTEKNVTVFGFDLVEGHSGVIENFRDQSHYKPEINNYMASAIVRGEHTVNMSDWDDYVEALIIKTHKFIEHFVKTESI